MKILLVDDHPLVIKGMWTLLQTRIPSVELFKAGSVEEARNLIRQIKPDIIFQDINLPDGNGFTLLKELKPETKAHWIMLSTYHDAEFVRESIEKGAKGYICKDAEDEEILQAIHTVQAGKLYFSSTVGGSLVEFHAAKRQQKQRFDKLSTAESRVLALVAQSKTSKEIAELLHVSHRTIENHRNNICSKLGLQGANALLHYAVQHKSDIDKDNAPPR